LELREKNYETALHIYTNYRIFMQARSSQWGRAFDLLLAGRLASGQLDRLGWIAGYATRQRWAQTMRQGR
jgi:hypothetical protein